MEEEYLRLLQLENDLKLEGRTLRRPDELKLLMYDISLWDHFKWERRNEYALLLADFLDTNIDIDQYREQFFDLESEIKNRVRELKLDLGRLKKFNPNPLSKGFADPIEQLLSDLRVCEPDPNLRDKYEISEIELIDGVRKISVQIQKYLNIYKS